MKDYIFHMKQFELRHVKSAMKVGTDSLLLGAWCPITGTEQNVLDIGSGCGILSLMLAQRLPQSSIVGIELDSPSYQESLYNVSHSKWKNRITMHHADVRSADFSNQFDLIVSNPPYYKALRPGSPGRTLARYQKSLETNELFFVVNKLLTPDGLCSLVIPFDQITTYLVQGEKRGLFPHQIVTVRHNVESKPTRILIAFGRDLRNVQRSQLIIGDHADRSEAYQALMNPFLLDTKTKKAIRR